ncbi:MFS transporter [Leptospira sp. GIMC2001]|uniref:MFS transporter n=1 Tax=Leptospira sp. GIMC2001 TaxID=1513297 RepID=UPI00234AF3BC|nr:MFS transporter [Leptospira sp. GIMC2001]WCL50374.1 MFS transporter [Leptospira sp. GIMC2001]
MERPKFPLGRTISYAIGQFGWSLLINIIGTWLVYFYLPPKEADLPILVTDVAIFGILNTIGIVASLGRLWDAITDPLIANYSDQLDTRWGRRVPMLAFGALPAALFCFLTFFPPDSVVSTKNLVWLVVMMFAFYFFLTTYVTPYFALIPELGRTPDERLNISTYISVTYFLGIAIAAQAPVMWGGMMSAYDLPKVDAVQYTLGGLSLLAMICMYFPVFAVDEKKYCQSEPSTVPFKEALILTFKNKSFLYFSLSDLAYFLSTTILQTGLIYYVTVLLVQEEQLQGLLMLVLGVTSFAMYPVVNILAKRIGKKPLVLVGFSIFFLVFCFCSILGQPWIPFSPFIQGILVVVFAAIPMAILGILPNAILADIAELDALKTGSQREGLFYAGRTLMQKMGQTLGILIFSSLLLLGRDTSNSTGIQATGPAAAFFCLLAILLFSKYKEKETLEEIERIRSK